MKRIGVGGWLLVLAWLPGLVLASPYTQLYVFGDSLSDNGNAAILTGGVYPQSPPYDPLRFSNGPLAVEGLAVALGVGLTPFALGGNNYALAGAATGSENYLGVAKAGMATEIGLFAAQAAVFDPARTLFVVWGGPNDFFIDPQPATVTQAAGNLAQDITALAGMGAQHFLVPNMPDLGLTPFGRSFGAAGAQYWSDLSLAFNLQLELELQQLETMQALDLIRFDTFGFLQEVVQDPVAFNFTNVIDACLSGGQVCADPDSYLFWDDVHPTQYANTLIAARFAAAVPEPSSIALLLCGFFMLARRARRSEPGWIRR